MSDTHCVGFPGRHDLDHLSHLRFKASAGQPRIIEDWGDIHDWLLVTSGQSRGIDMIFSVGSLDHFKYQRVSFLPKVLLYDLYSHCFRSLQRYQRYIGFLLFFKLVKDKLIDQEKWVHQLYLVSFGNPTSIVKSSVESTPKILVTWYWQLFPPSSNRLWEETRRMELCRWTIFRYTSPNPRDKLFLRRCLNDNDLLFLRRCLNTKTW